MQIEYKYYWLYGAFDILSGESFYWEYNKMTKLNYQHFITDLSKKYPDSLNIILMDNSKTHDTEIEFDNIKFINTDPYSPDLNPAERVWHFIKDKLNWETFESISQLQEFVNQHIKQITNQQILSLTSFSYLIQACHALNI